MEWQEAFIAETCKLLNCDRATLFLVDNVTRVAMRTRRPRGMQMTRGMQHDTRHAT